MNSYVIYARTLRLARQKMLSCRREACLPCHCLTASGITGHKKAHLWHILKEEGMSVGSYISTVSMLDFSKFEEIYKKSYVWTFLSWTMLDFKFLSRESTTIFVLKKGRIPQTTGNEKVCPFWLVSAIGKNQQEPSNSSAEDRWFWGHELSLGAIQKGPPRSGGRGGASPKSTKLSSL